MTEFISSRSKIPEFVAYPLTKSVVAECLHSLPQDSISLSFVSWSSDTGFKRKMRGDRRKKMGLTENKNTTLLWVYFGAWSEAWTIYIYPVRKQILQPIKAALVPDGLLRLRGWLAEQAKYVTSNSRLPGSFRIEFDGQELAFIEK